MAPLSLLINNTYSIAGNLSKTVSFFGQLTFSAGYSFDQPGLPGSAFTVWRVVRDSR